MTPSVTINMVFFGDSLTLGVPVYQTDPTLTYPAVVQTLVPNSVQTTLGFPDQTTDELNAHYSDALSKYQPDQINVLVLWAGTNDLAVGDVTVAFQNILSMVAAAEAAGFIVAVLTMLPRENYFSDDVHKINFENNRKLFNLSMLTSDLLDIVIDPAALLPDPNDYNMFWDQCHLQAKGYNFVAQLAAYAIKAALTPSRSVSRNRKIALS